MEDLVVNIVGKKLGTEVCVNTHLSDVVQDSMAKLEALFEIEAALGIKIPHEEIMDIETVGDIAKIAARLKGSHRYF